MVEQNRLYYKELEETRSMCVKLENELEVCKEKLNNYEPASVGNHEEIAMYADLPTSNLNDEEIESDEIVTFERVQQNDERVEYINDESSEDKHLKSELAMLKQR